MVKMPANVMLEIDPSNFPPGPPGPPGVSGGLLKQIIVNTIPTTIVGGSLGFVFFTTPKITPIQTAGNLLTTVSLQKRIYRTSGGSAGSISLQRSVDDGEWITVGNMNGFFLTSGNIIDYRGSANLINMFNFSNINNVKFRLVISDIDTGASLTIYGINSCLKHEEF